MDTREEWEKTVRSLLIAVFILTVVAVPFVFASKFAIWYGRKHTTTTTSVYTTRPSTSVSTSSTSSSSSISSSFSSSSASSTRTTSSTSTKQTTLTISTTTSTMSTTTTIKQNGNTVTFGGYTWNIEKSSSIEGPGDNYFYYNSNSDYVDGSGYLHMGIFNVNGKRYSSEIYTQQALGYGTYNFTVQGDASKLDRCAVLGMFTWDDSSTSATGNQFNREIDMEMSKWCDSGNVYNAEIGVQPETSGMVDSFNMNYTGDVVFSMHWMPNEVDYVIKQATTGKVIEQWNYAGSGVPTPGNAGTHINLWADYAPTSGNVTVVIKSFSFTPN